MIYELEKSRLLFHYDLQRFAVCVSEGLKDHSVFTRKMPCNQQVIGTNRPRRGHPSSAWAGWIQMK